MLFFFAQASGFNMLKNMRNLSKIKSKINPGNNDKNDSTAESQEVEIRFKMNRKGNQDRNAAL